MATSQGDARGGTRAHSGRKKVFLDKKEKRKSWGKAHKRIYLTINTFDAWANAKIQAGYDRSSDSVFAKHLLSLEFRRR